MTILATDPDPDRAIRLAFAAAERGFGTLPQRHTSETPFEWYRRVSVEQPALADHLSGLCAAFANTRFTPHPSTLDARDAALANLRHLHRVANDPRPGTARRGDRPGPGPSDTPPGPRDLTRVGGGG